MVWKVSILIGKEEAKITFIFSVEDKERYA